MKKRDWKIVLISVGVTLGLFFLIALILHLFSFEIVYDPKVISNWDAVSGVASWVGVIVSIVAVCVSALAIYYAIQVPKKIADRQDKIALFEKRYECFQFFEKCMILCSNAEKEETLDNLQRDCCAFIGEYILEDIDPRTVLSKVDNFEYVLHSMEFLFPGIEENDLQGLYVSLERFFVSVILGKSSKTHIDTFVHTMKEFQRKYGRLIWDYVAI